MAVECPVCKRVLKSSQALKWHLPGCEKKQGNNSSYVEPGGGIPTPPKLEEEDIMGELTKEDLAQIVTMAVATVVKDDRERHAGAKEDPTRIAQIESYCKQFPALCEKITALEKKTKEGAEKSEIHKTASEYLACPECGNALLKKAAKLCREDPKFCESFQALLDKEGFTLAEKEKVEESSGLF